MDALLPVERDGWVQHRATYGHAASQMRACGKCMDAMVAMRDELAREVVAPRERAASAEAVCATWRQTAEAVGARVALLEGLPCDVHADLYDTMSPRLNRRIMAALADGG